MNDAGGHAVGDLRGLDTPALARLWVAARRRVERSGLGFGSSPITLRNLSADEVTAVCGLLGARTPPGSSVRVDLARLDTTLRNGRAGVGLLEVLEALDGPLTDRTAQRRAEVTARASLWDRAFAHEASQDPHIESWLRRVRRTGRLTRLDTDDPAAVLDGTLGVLMRLIDARDPADPLHHRAALAADLFGDAHALDADRPIGTLVLDAILTLTGDADRRSAWARLGIEVDAISTSALTLNLRCAASSIVSAAAALGEPLRITPRMLRGDLAFGRMDRVYVCENPTVLGAAADRLGAAAPPMVCTEGWPATVTSELLERLSASAPLAVRADFDVQGVAIVAFVLDRAVGAEPWRFSSTDYLDEVDTARLRGRVRLNGTVADVPWDDQLAASMRHHGLAIHEEAMLGRLLDDLSH